MNEWYWCLSHSRVEAASERDDIENSLGPYPSIDAAQNWREQVERRNESWQIEDDRWEGADPDEDPEGA